MKVLAKILLILAASLTALNSSAQKRDVLKPRVVYKSKDLVVTQVSRHSFVHTSFLKTEDFGNVPCNGLIVTNSNEAIIFDTPTNEKSSEDLIKWIQETLHSKVNAIVPTHFHNDCLGGLTAFHQHSIPSYAYFKTIELAKENGFTVPENSFSDSLILKAGNEKAIVKFLGEGHTKDNVVAYFPADHILFGGCLVKELKASKGYLGDANVAAWSGTVEKVKKEYPDIKLVVPGHGKPGDKDLLDYTIALFRAR